MKFNTDFYQLIPSTREERHTHGVQEQKIEEKFFFNKELNDCVFFWFVNSKLKFLTWWECEYVWESKWLQSVISTRCCCCQFKWIWTKINYFLLLFCHLSHVYYSSFFCSFRASLHPGYWSRAYLVSQFNHIGNVISWIWNMLFFSVSMMAIDVAHNNFKILFSFRFRIWTTWHLEYIEVLTEIKQYRRSFTNRGEKKANQSCHRCCSQREI